jgi:alanine dehydrogenase
VLIGVPKEIKVHEYRVGLTPESVRAATAHGHGVLVEKSAGVGIGATDADYRAVGAVIADSAQQVFAEAELIVKIKEPQAPERARLRSGQALFTYLHLAPDPEQTRELVASGAIAIAYETVTGLPPHKLPLLAPMSEVAGRMSIQVAAHYLERPHGGRGVLLSGAGGVPPAKLVVLGAGVVGSNAARIAVGMGAEVIALNRSSGPLERLAAAFGASLKTMVSNPE